MNVRDLIDSYDDLLGWNDSSKASILSNFIDALSEGDEPIEPAHIERRLTEFLREQALSEGVTDAEIDGDEDEDEDDSPYDLDDDDSDIEFEE